MIESKTQRAKLTPRREPYWQRLRAGRHLGYRKLQEGAGTWIAKYRGDDGKRLIKALRLEDGDAVNAHELARRKAERWFAELDKGVEPRAVTVKDACDRYVAKIRREEGEAKAKRAEADFRRLVDADPIAKLELGRLRADHLEKWRDRISAAPARIGRGERTKEAPRARATINRDMVPLRAALNAALDAQLVATDLAWRVALRPLRDADQRRTIYLDRDERRRLLEHADAAVCPFLQGLMLLPLRPGALAALTAADVDARLSALRVGRDKTDGGRWITLPASTAAILAAWAKDKLPGAPLLAMPDGRPWAKDAWKGPVKAAVKAAGLPAATTAYTLRHSTITDLVKGGLDLLTVAQISGTSVAMIEKHYGHLQREHAAQALAGLAL